MSSKAAKSNVHSNTSALNNGGVVVGCGRSLTPEQRLGSKNTKTPGSILSGINKEKVDVTLTSYNDEYYKPTA